METRANSRVILAAAMAASVGIAGARASISAATRVLHFPRDQSVGVVYVQDDNLVVPGIVKGFQPVHAERENFSCARGEVRIPPGKHVILTIRGVGATPTRCRTALESLGPDDLYGLEFFSMGPVRLPPDLVPLIARLTGLRRLVLGNVEISSDGLAQIARLPSLEDFHPPLSLSDAGMAQIAKIQSLRRLNLGPDRTTDRGLALLDQLKSLEELDLYGNRAITDDALKALVDLPMLRYLRLGKEGVFTDRGMEYLAAMPSLKVLWLDTHNVTDEGLRRLSKSRSLERLCIYWLTQITDRGVGYLKDMPQFKGLDAGQTSLTDAGLAHFKGMPNVDWLGLPGGVTDAGVQSLAELDRLEVLRLNCAGDSPLTDQALKTFSQIRGLRELHVAGNGFTDAGIDLLAELPHLEVLSIGHPGLNNETLKRLAGLPRLKDLRWFFWSDVTLSGLNALDRLTGLNSLCVHDVRQDHQGLDLSNLRNLRILAIAMRVQRTRVGGEMVYTSDAFHDSDLACLRELTELENLSLGSPGIGNEGMQHLALLARLKYLTIGGGPNLTDDGLKHLAHMRRLDTLHIGDSRITDRGLEHLYPLKTLHILRIKTGVPISQQAILRLHTELPHLQSLELSQPEPARAQAVPRPKAR